MRELLRNDNDATTIGKTLPIVTRLSTRISDYAIHGLEIKSGLEPVILEIFETADNIDFRHIVLETGR